MLPILLFAILAYVQAKYTGNFGSFVKPTSGEVWPQPQSREYYEGFFLIRPTFKFKTTGKSCTMLLEAFERYEGILVARKDSIKAQTSGKNSHKRKKTDSTASVLDDNNFHGYLDSLDVSLQNACDDAFPTPDMDESYYLEVTSKHDSKAFLTANSKWGILRGLETFTQLVHLASDQTSLIINATSIRDYPRFPHRGLSVDTSRHFLPVQFILQILDAMSYNKMNVFHWHIVDDQSFPYQSEKFPELSNLGAYHPTAVYRPEDIKQVVRYAAFRGIRVIPEFNIPAHTFSWGAAMPELLTSCYRRGKYAGYGPMDPSKNLTYSVLTELFREVAGVFPDEYVHLGGNDVEFDCWETDAAIRRYMVANRIFKYNKLEEHFFQKVFNIISNVNKTIILWADVIEDNVKLRHNTVFQIWKPQYEGLLRQITFHGYRALLSSCWNLEDYNTSWSTMYDCDPRNFSGTEKQHNLVLGGEACLWSENINQYNIIPKIWPRTSAVAEVLWSARNASTKQFADERLQEHTCRMNFRGIAAEPPGGSHYCV